MTTYKQVEAEMLKIVKAQPNFNYRKFREKQLGGWSRTVCSYIDEDDEGSCIWGQSLVNAGVPIENIKQHEGESISHVFELLGINAGEEEARFAEFVQQYQDSGMDFDLALNNALEDTGYELVYTS